MSCLLFCRICDKLFKCSAFKHHQNQELQYDFTKGLKELSLPSTNEMRAFFLEPAHRPPAAVVLSLVDFS